MARSCVARRVLDRQLTSRRVDGVLLILVGWTLMDLGGMFSVTTGTAGFVIALAALGCFVTGLWWLVRPSR